MYCGCITSRHLCIVKFCGYISNLCIVKFCVYISNLGIVTFCGYIGNLCLIKFCGYISNLRIVTFYGGGKSFYIMLISLKRILNSCNCDIAKSIYE